MLTKIADSNRAEIFAKINKNEKKNNDKIA